MIVAIHSQIRPNDTQLNALGVKPPLMRSFISIRFNEIRTIPESRASNLESRTSNFAYSSAHEPLRRLRVALGNRYREPGLRRRRPSRDSHQSAQGCRVEARRIQARRA